MRRIAKAVSDLPVAARHRSLPRRVHEQLLKMNPSKIKPILVFARAQSPGCALA
jgi:hypothetical protein